MIIKKNKVKNAMPPAYASQPQSVQGHDPGAIAMSPYDMAEAYAQAQQQTPPMPIDPYQGMLSTDDFLSGRLPDRRRRTREDDRRQQFRRDEDTELIASAQREADSIREAARQEGLNEGLTQAEPVIDELREAVDALLNARDEAIIAAGKELGALSIEIAQKIMQVEISCDEQLVLDIVKKSLKRAGKDQKIITIHVHPSQVAMMEEAIELKQVAKPNAQLYVQENDDVDVGSCMIETQAGLIDTRFNTQLEVLRKLIVGGSAS